jgi:hypothetical protein
MKERVDRNRPHTMQKLERDIRDEVAAINQELLRRIICKFCESLKTNVLQMKEVTLMLSIYQK